MTGIFMFGTVVYFLSAWSLFVLSALISYLAVYAIDHYQELSVKET